MTDTATAPTQTAPQTAPQAAVEAVKDLRARAGRPSSADVVARIAEKQAARESAKAPEPAPAPDATPAPAPADAATPPPAAPPADDSLLRRAQQAVQAETQRRIEAERKAKELEARAAKASEFEQLRELIGKNPAEGLKRLGLDFQSFVKDVADGKTVPYTREQIEIEGTNSKVAELEAQLSELRQEREARMAEERRAQRAASIAAELKDHADFPTLASVPWAAARLAEMHERGGEAADLVELARGLESAVVADVRHVLSSERAIKHLVSDPETRSRIVKALGLETTSNDTTTPPGQHAATGQLAASSSPRTLTNAVAAAVGDRASRVLSHDVRRARAIAAASRHAQKA